jgi:hypothetical protein
MSAVVTSPQRAGALPVRLRSDAGARPARRARCSALLALRPRAVAAPHAGDAVVAPQRPAPAALPPAWRSAAFATLAAIALAAPQPAALAAAAFSGVIELSDLAYTVEVCPAGFFLPERARCKCLHVTATAKNGLKSAVEAASVFGFITDVNGDSAAAVRHSA